MAMGVWVWCRIYPAAPRGKQLATRRLSFVKFEICMHLLVIKKKLATLKEITKCVYMFMCEGKRMLDYPYAMLPGHFVIQFQAAFSFFNCATK